MKSDDCYDKVATLLDQLSPGDMLPSANALAKTMGFSHQKICGCMRRWCKASGRSWELEAATDNILKNVRAAMRSEMAARSVDRSLSWRLNCGVKVSD